MKRTLLPATLITLLLWLVVQNADVLSMDQGIIALRRTLIILTGALSLLWMSFTVMLATRPAWLEQRIGGLDRMYRLHKWAGIGGTVLVLAHWLLEKSPPFLAWLGLLAPRGSRPHGAHEAHALMDLAKLAGEWAFYLMALMVVIALARKLPYRLFRQAHKVFPVLFLMAAYHSVMFVPQSYYTQPIGWLIFALAAAGSIAAVWCLSGRIGQARQYHSALTAVTVQENGLLDLRLATPKQWPGHRAGQFVLVTFDAKEGAHPFTLASAAPGEANMRLVIKALGDYTRTLADSLKPGAQARIEGPYGHFSFDDARRHQIWIAGGIGITPFMARLQALAAQPRPDSEVDFYYATQTAADNAFPPELDALCARAGVRLHRRVQAHEGVFRADEVFASLDEQRSSIWYCGPKGWAQALRKNLNDRGVRADLFHSEAFDFR